MKELNKIESIIFLFGGLLMAIGACCFAVMWQQKVMCWIYLVGAALFTFMQIQQLYEGNDLTIKRLKHIQGFADVLFILAGILMIDTAYQLFLPLFQNANGTGYYTYINYIYNKWVILLLIAAILEIYTTHRICSELQKTKNP